MEGFFHNAHAVYYRQTSTKSDWAWIATFATRDLAQAYLAFAHACDVDPRQYELRPV